jgi:ribosome-binding protein aMBF1 (putative translation factor)
MTAPHSSSEELAAQSRDSDEYREGYAEARRAFLIGQAVRERRLALGLSQVELAARADMTQPALSRLEAGGVVPTIPLPERISAAWTLTSSSKSRPTPPEQPVTPRQLPAVPLPGLPM